VTMAGKEATTSYANMHGEDWETKEISVYGAAKSFITQITVGMDLTHVSIPALFLLPYSILEFIAVRTSSAFHLLLPLGKEKDPQKRLEGILKYCLGSAKESDLMLNHKPSNPILGEVHKGRMQHPDGTYSYVLCEQTKHHPPTSAFEINNPDHGVRLAGNMLFGVVFHSNSVTVEIKGGLKIYLTLEDGTEELYLLEEGIPDMYLKNVLLGTKYVFWTVQLTVKCPSTGFRTNLVYGFKDGKNTVNGLIWNENEMGEPKGAKEEKSAGWASRWAKATVNAAKATAKFSTGWIYDYEGEDAWMNTLKLPFNPATVKARFGGVCGQEIYVYPGALPLKGETKEYPNKYVLINSKDVTSQECDVYPAPEDLEEHSSIKVWRAMGEAIVNGDMEKADIEKTKVEEAQRDRRKEGTSYAPVFFEEENKHGWDFWAIKDPQWFKNDRSNLYVAK